LKHVPHGYHGGYLRVDVTSGRSSRVPIEEQTLRRYVGGVGLGTWIVSRETPAGCDPLGRDAALVFALSPLVGSPLTTSAKFAVVAISPLTGRLCDALCSSHFALAAKRTGFDAIVLRGACEAPAIVLVDETGEAGDPRVTIEPAGALWGLPAAEAERRIRAERGPGWQVIAIGPAGERLIPFATLTHDGRHAGRGGLGAVMGAKRVKALAVRGGRRTTLADPARTVALARSLSERALGPATEKYRELGTIANLLVFNRFNTLPTRNFGSGRFEAAGQLVGEDLAPARKLARNSCASCTIGCEHIFAAPGGGGVRLEYESLFALGPLCGVSDRGAVLRAASACDAAGLDTISTGGTIAFLMDCASRGWLGDATLPTGRRLAFGDGEAVVEAIAATVAREGLGELIALGSRRAAGRIGGEAPSIAMHVKGLELPGYDPRALPTLALGLAVGTRGADHNRSGAYEADFSGRADRGSGAAQRAALAIETEDRAALIDSLILCKFLRGVFTDLYAEAAGMLAAVTGWDVTADELRQVARRVVNARKCLNLREGSTRAEDTLPEALLGDARGGAALTAAGLEAMIDAYYRQRGWDPRGRIPKALRRELHLDD
jgi:aldehyde:ferredoxin oxidoreductase